MLRLVFKHVKPEKEGRLRAWLAELMERQDEVRETFARETVRHEQGFIIDGRDGPILIYAIEAEDHEKGHEAFKASTLPIDVEHKSVMREVLGDRLDVEAIYDCSVREATT